MTSTTELVAARATDLDKIKNILTEQRARRLDIVVSSTAMEARDDGKLHVKTGEVHMDETGVTPLTGAYDVGDVWNEHAARRLDLPGAYLRKWNADRPDLWAAVVNGKLNGGKSTTGRMFPADDQKHLLRLLKGDDDGPGFARALLGQRYGFIESLDALVAVMQGIRDAGVEVVPEICDLTERKLFVNFVAPQVAALAPTLLAGYRNHFGGGDAHLRAGDGEGAALWSARHGNWTLPAALAAAEREGQALVRPGEAPPVLRAGFRLSNSETGHGKRTLVPFLKVAVCGNRLVLDVEADEKIHLGAIQGEGVVEWSQATIDRELALIQSQTVDLVTRYLSQSFLDEQVARIEGIAGAPVRKPEATVREIVAKVGFTKGQAEDVFSFFVEGGQPTAGGLANAMTAYAQTVDDALLAADLERKAIPAMELAAARAAA
jgi:hypothetical protein